MKFRTFAVTALSLLLLVGGVATMAQSTPLPPGIGQIRVIHASAETSNIDVYLGRSQTPFIKNLAFGTGTGFISLPVATYVISVRPAGAPPETDPVATGTFVNSEGFSANIVIIGLLDRQGSRAVKFMEVPVNFDPTWGQARVQVIHASPDTPRIDLLSNNIVAMDGLLYGDGLFTGVTYAPGTYNFAVVQSNQVTAKGEVAPVFINMPNMPLAANTLYTVIAIGLRQDIHALVFTDSIPVLPPTVTPVPTWTPTPTGQ